MRSLLIDLGVPSVSAGNLFADITARYAEPHRRYHTSQHIVEVTAEVDRLLGVVRCSADAASAVRLAVWFHDAIYDPTVRGGVNEDASAGLATMSLLSVGVAQRIVTEVARLVRLTADHQVAPTDVAGSVLVDADLSILAADGDRYDRYVRDVRAEYRHVSDETWGAGRGSVLHHLLGAAPLYRVGPDRTQREQAARANMQRELAQLKAPVSDQRRGATVDAAAPPPGVVGQAPGG